MQRSAGGHQMIADKIKNDITGEFASLKEGLQIHLKPDFNVSQAKQFLETHIPKEIVYKSEILLDTLLNYLMDDARERIKTADLKLQNAFFDADFRQRVHEWTRQLENKLALDPDIVTYTSDPRLTKGWIASGMAFVAGTSVTLVIAPSVIGAIIAGIITIFISAAAFKIAYDKASPKAREIIKTDIKQYLKSSQEQVIEWLEKVEKTFDGHFSHFCMTNNFAPRGRK